jgi:hypothetical protein
LSFFNESRTFSGTSQAKSSKDQSGMHRPDPINDEPVDYIDVVATDSPTKMTLNEKNGMFSVDIWMV